MKTITGSLVPGGNGMLRPIFTCSCRNVMEDYALAPAIAVQCPKCQATQNFRVSEFAPKRWRIKAVG